MKARYIAFIWLTLLIAACSNDDHPDSPLSPESITHVSLCIAPSVEQSELPMSRAGKGQTAGLYAINVFWKGKGITGFSPYVSGLFDDISQVEISLINGYQYRFDCTFLTADELPYSILKEETEQYGLPFAIKGSMYAPVTNRLIVALEPFDTNTQFYQGIYSGRTETEEGIILSQPSLHRYYGSSSVDLTPAQTDEYVNVEIELKRAYYHLQFESEDIPLHDRIRVRIADDITPFILYGRGETGIIRSDERLLSLKKTADRWNGGIGTADELSSVTTEYYTFATDTWHPLYQKAITIKPKRNKRNIFRFVNIDQATGEGHINLGEGEIAGPPTDSEQQEIK